MPVRAIAYSGTRSTSRPAKRIDLDAGTVREIAFKELADVGTQAASLDRAHPVSEQRILLQELVEPRVDDSVGGLEPAVFCTSLGAERLAVRAEELLRDGVEERSIRGLANLAQRRPFGAFVQSEEILKEKMMRAFQKRWMTERG